ncbi:Proteasome activator subunit 4 [Rhynchospora pubera]|uniref:Proteasome activator subunit 4 n=1 Tax=Rhynchospora pubera TaxID=906938 RepID=A0AAV8FJY4_9POAL|nr:Proteasome activator subunit 4 [Rhynchospora pubera]
MHLYNAWLPPPAVEETKKEAEAFASVVQSVKDAWAGPTDPDSVYATLKWISLIDLFIKAKSELSSENVQQLIELGLEVFHASQDKLHAQVRWGGVIVRLLKKHGKKLSLSIKWRPFYETLMHTHFKRNTGPEGWKVRQRHFETVTSLIRSCRKFFPEGAASEIWSEFRPLMANPWHNAAFEGCGFLKLFLPVNPNNQDFFTSDWLADCLDLWESIPNCQFWDIQWTSIISRCIKSCKLIDWEGFLPTLFTRFLNMFEVPVSNGTGSYPFPMEAPKNMRFLFSSKSVTPAKAIAKSIVYLLKPDGAAQLYFERLTNLLEQYYHPSNGGRWTYTLERFLRYLVIYFQKRLQGEQLKSSSDKFMSNKPSLRKEERALFVSAVLKLIDRGQYSKNDSLAETVSVATSVLAYIEPSVVLPHIAMKFQLALETMTATHQLKNAVASVAFAGRPLLLASLSGGVQSDDSYSTETYLDLIFTSLSNALLGMDANDPPKTVATMQLIGSIFSNLAMVGGSDDVPVFLQSTHLSEWLDEFFVRLFSLLQNLEPNSVINEGAQTSLLSGTFLAQDSPYYYCMLEVLLGKLSKPLFNQSLKKISKFVDTNILPGATAEVGLLICACVHSDPEEAGLHLIKLILKKIVSSFNGTPVAGYVEGAAPSTSPSKKATLSPALETSLEYHLRVLAIAVSYAGPGLLKYRDDFKQVIMSAFQAPSWKVNSSGENVLRSLLASLISYYPLDQYRPSSSQPVATILERWGCAKADLDEKTEELDPPKWHIPSQEEINFAKELLQCHLISPLENLQNICQTETQNEAGDKKEHLKVTLLRIYSSLHGVMSCLPDIRPTLKNESSKKVETSCFFIAGSSGPTVGTAEMREKAAEVIHSTCRYLLKERTDDSILLILVIRLMDALGNHGSLEYDEWLNHIHAWKLESAAIVESSCNFITSSHSPGKKRPRWALIDRAYLHNTWRSSQSAYHKYRNNGNILPSEHTVLLAEDLLELSLHNYETVRGYAVRTMMKVLKRWPSLISKCVLISTSHLLDPKASEHLIIGSCNILGTKTVLKHLTMDAVSFSSFVTGILASSHHESLKAQKAITELFVKYNIHFSGISKSFFGNSVGQLNRPGFEVLVSQITSLSFDTNGLHWRYNLMANRILLLLILSSRSESNISSNILGESVVHFLRNLKSQLPHSRMLAISALNTLLQGTSTKSQGDILSVESNMTQILQEEGFLLETLNSLSHVHIISDTDSSASKGSQGASSFQSGADKAMTFFYFDFSASWPRTPSWISLVAGDTFYSSFARIFKRLVQECGTPLLHSLRVSLEEFLSSKERSKQCVAAEAMAGMLHSDVSGILEEWDNWIMSRLVKVLTTPSVESVPEWAACFRYALTSKGKYGSRIPALRQKILDCLAVPVPTTVATSVVAKRYSFLSVCLIEISPVGMGPTEEQFHIKMLEELLDNMSHSSAQVREAIGVTLSVICSNMRLLKTSEPLREVTGDTVMSEAASTYENWAKLITEKARELSFNIQNTSQSNKMDSTLESVRESGLEDTETTDAKTMETIFHFAVASLKSGRSSVLLDVLVGFINPILSLQETSNKDLSTLAKATFELLKWRILRRPFLQDAVSVILSLVRDPNWRTRSASLRYIQTFMYRHTFTLSNSEKSQIWQGVEKLLVDNQVEVREHAAGVLASLMKGGDKELSNAFRERSYAEAVKILTQRKQRNSASGLSIVTVHGAVLSLTASVLSVPYDMPRWLPDHVTLLARFVSEPSPVKSTVTKAVAEFRRTHADTWSIQKDAFSEEQLEVLADISSSSSYFA